MQRAHQLLLRSRLAARCLLDLVPHSVRHLVLHVRGGPTAHLPELGNIQMHASRYSSSLRSSNTADTAHSDTASGVLWLVLPWLGKSLCTSHYLSFVFLRTSPTRARWQGSRYSVSRDACRCMPPVPHCALRPASVILARIPRRSNAGTGGFLVRAADDSRQGLAEVSARWERCQRAALRGARARADRLGRRPLAPQDNLQQRPVLAGRLGAGGGGRRRRLAAPHGRPRRAAPAGRPGCDRGLLLPKRHLPGHLPAPGVQGR